MILNYTTTIEPEQTVSEIQKMLSKHGVSAMMTEYDGPEVSAVSFRMLMNGQQVGFRLPCNWRAVLEVFKQQGIRQGMIKSKDKDMNHQAQRTAWRIVKDWVEAQLAMVEVNMVTVPQVFLPYMIMKDQRTLAEHVATDPKFLLGNGE